MNIDRHNYEEYFILYMDNELSSEQLRMVEHFVQNNPDLKEELDMLLQSKLIPDNNISFEGKEELFKIPAESFINETNYEEWLVLYLDNELPVSERTSVEKFISENPSIKTELELLKKTKLQPEEEIIFPDKELLYRRTGKVRPIAIRWPRLWQAFGDRRWRIAVAAMLILFAGISGIIVLNNRKKSVQPEIAVQQTGKKINTENITTKKPELTNNNTEIQSLATTNKNQISSQIKRQQEKSSIEKKKENDISPEKKSLYNLPEELKTDAPLIADNTTNDLPLPSNNPNVKIKESSVPDLAINDYSNNKTLPAQSESKSVTNPTQGSYTKMTAPENTNEQSGATYASLEEGSNKKTRGLFRKAIRIFEKTTKINPTNDDDRVLIGGLAVNLR